MKVSALAKFLYEFGPFFGTALMVYGFFIAITGYWLLDMNIFLNISFILTVFGSYLTLELFEKRSSQQ